MIHVIFKYSFLLSCNYEYKTIYLKKYCHESKFNYIPKYVYFVRIFARNVEIVHINVYIIFYNTSRVYYYDEYLLNEIRKK